MPSDAERDRYVLIAVVIAAAALIAYSALISQRIVLGIGSVVPLFLLYLAWRFVRAHERIADALEARERETTDRAP